MEHADEERPRPAIDGATGARAEPEPGSDDAGEEDADMEAEGDGHSSTNRRVVPSKRPEIEAG